MEALVFSMAEYILVHAMLSFSAQEEYKGPSTQTRSTHIIIKGAGNGGYQI